MKTRLVLILTALVVMLAAALPALADGPLPADKGQAANLKSPVASGGGSGANAPQGAKAKAPVSAPAAVKEGPAPASVSKASPAEAGIESAAATVRTWTGSTSIWRNGWNVYTRGRTESTVSEYYMYVANYGCRYGACTNWTSYAGYWYSWVWAGWTFAGSTYGNFSSRSHHYIKTYYNQVWDTYTSNAGWY